MRLQFVTKTRIVVQRPSLQPKAETRRRETGARNASTQSMDKASTSTRTQLGLSKAKRSDVGKLSIRILDDGVIVIAYDLMRTGCWIRGTVGATV